MTTSLFVARPVRVEKQDTPVMGQHTVDDLPHIREIWPSFERLVGVRGRRMYARADLTRNTYTVCTPIREDDDPESLGLQRGTLRGGPYLRGRLAGEPSVIFSRIEKGMTELRALMPMDQTRPLVEFYRRHNEVELWVPILASHAATGGLA
jgi:hypothetical protein